MSHRVVPGNDDYGIGIICALPIELAAITAVLDEEYSVSDFPRSNNTYRSGRMAGHNVVITCLPAGRIGTTAAAVAATHMVRDFKNLRLSLLVGIGSGVPSSRHDIRLGDVVVSTPSKSHPGVIQYDLGRHIQGEFHRKGYLHAPPNLLLLASAHEKAEAIEHGHELGLAIETIIAQRPKLRSRFMFPGPQDDRLFRPEQTLKDVEMQGDVSLRNEQIARPQRADPNDPQVHYGLIASGNTRIKDGNLRDRLVSDLGDVLCFEMEAAGIMEDLPTMVIRGICDYADIYRYESWQGYAALAAAVYTKRLLRFLPTEAIVRQPNIADILDLETAPEVIAHNDGSVSDSASDIFSDASARGMSSATSVSELSLNTRVDGIDSALLGIALQKIANLLSTETGLTKLCNAAILRMKASILERHLAKFLVSLRKSMRQSKDPLKKDLAKIFKNNQNDIARDICELLGFRKELYPQSSSPLNKLDPTEEERFERFMIKRYTAATLRSASTQLLDNTGIVDNRDDESDADVDDEEADEEPPLVENLKALDRYSQVLFDPTYDIHLNELKGKIFPSAIQTIRKVLQRHWPRNSKSHNITCVISWQFLRYILSQEISFDQLDPTFTITGRPDCCGVSTLATYIKSTWGTELLDLLRSCFSRFRDAKDCSNSNVPFLGDPFKDANLHIIDNCDIQLFYQDESHRFTRSIVVSIAGTFKNVSRVLEQFAWLTSTLREDRATQLTISEIQFEAVYDKKDDEGIRTERSSDTYSPYFRMTLRDQSTSLQPDSKETGQCWTQFFRPSILAYGFPLPNPDRPEGMLGLETPFDIMVSFIGDVYPVIFDGRLTFAGKSVMMLPQTFAENAIQWHIKDTQELLRHVEKSKDPTAMDKLTLEASDILGLIRPRAFFGYCTYAEVLLGTKEFSKVETPNSEVRDVDGEPKIKREFPIGLNFSALGIATTTFSSTFRFSPPEVVHIEDQNIPTQMRIQNAKSTSILLYDQSLGNAFLVSELSVALQMSIKYLQDIELEETKIPFATLGADGGQAAYNAIRSARNLDVTQQAGEPQKLYDIIRIFLKIFGQTRRQREVEKENFWTFKFSKGLRGWDYADMQTGESDFCSRGLKMATDPPIWWELFRSPKTLVLFTRMGKSVIRASRAMQTTPRCQAWDDKLEKDMLVAPVKQLLHLKKDLCTPASTHQPQYMLNNILYWARPLHKRLFDEPTCHEGGKCNPVQSMLPLDKVRPHDTHKPLIVASPGLSLDDYPHGAVLFSHKPNALEARPCKIVSPASLPAAAPTPVPAQESTSAPALPSTAINETTGATSNTNNEVVNALKASNTSRLSSIKQFLRSLPRLPGKKKKKRSQRN